MGEKVRLDEILPYIYIILILVVTHVGPGRETRTWVDEQLVKVGRILVLSHF